MRKWVAAALIILSSASNAEVIYITVGLPAACVGEKFKLSDANEILYRDRACDLPLVNKKDMRRYVFSAQGTTWDGCWANLLGDRITTISSDGSQDVRSKLELVEAETRTDGTAVITKASPCR